jgi:hypothetical protein
MQIAQELWDIARASDTSLWLAVTATILLITVILASAYDGNASLLIDQKRLRGAALVVGILFFATVAIRVYTIVP